MTSRLPLYLLLATFAFLAACSHSGTSAIESISVRLTEVKRASDGAAQVSITYINSSVLPIGVSETRHKIYLNGSLVGEIESERAIGLPAAGTVTQELPFTPTAGFAGVSGDANYRLETTLIVLAGEERLTARPRHEGVVPVR